MTFDHSWLLLLLYLLAFVQSMLSRSTPTPTATVVTPTAAPMVSICPTLTVGLPVATATSMLGDPSSPLPPSVISLNDDILLCCPPPLIPHNPKEDAHHMFLSQDTLSPAIPSIDNSDLDAATAHLFASLQLKQKTPTLEISLEDSSQPRKLWFTTSSLLLSTSSLLSMLSLPLLVTSSHKHIQTSVADCIESATVDIAEAIHLKIQLDFTYYMRLLHFFEYTSVVLIGL